MCKYKTIPSNIGSLRAANVLNAVATRATEIVINVTCLHTVSKIPQRSLMEAQYQFWIS